MQYIRVLPTWPFGSSTDERAGEPGDARERENAIRSGESTPRRVILDFSCNDSERLVGTVPAAIGFLVGSILTLPEMGLP